MHATLSSSSWNSVRKCTRRSRSSVSISQWILSTRVIRSRLSEAGSVFPTLSRISRKARSSAKRSASIPSSPANGATEAAGRE